MPDKHQTTETDTSGGLRCGRCLRIIEKAAAIAGVCTAEGCEELLCGACWSAPDDHLCERHQPSRVDRLESARRRAAAGHGLSPVTTGQARQMALTFLTRFEYQVRQLKALSNPLTGAVYQSDDLGPSRWKAHPARLVPPWEAEDDLDAAAPAGSRLVIPVRDELVLEAAIACRSDRYAEDGFDQRPLEMLELGPVLREAVRQTEAAGRVCVLGIASPTGWGPSATDFIASPRPGQSFLNRLLLPFLVDLRLARVWSNQWDARLTALPALFEVLTPEEIVRAVTDWLVAACLRQGSIPLSQAVAETGATPGLVQQASAGLAGAGAHAVVEVPSIGLTLTRC